VRKSAVRTLGNKPNLLTNLLRASEALRDRWAVRSTDEDEVVSFSSFSSLAWQQLPELGMSQSSVASAFDKFNFAGLFWFRPHALRHNL